MNIENFVHLIQGQGNFLYRCRCPRPLNGGVRLIKVVLVWLMWDSFRDFRNYPLNTGRPLNGGPLNTGFTVIVKTALLINPEQIS